MSKTLYKNCPVCNNSLVIMDEIYEINCLKCKSRLIYNERTEELHALEKIKPNNYKESKKNNETKLGKTRNYLVYFLFGLVTLGIGFLYYLFVILKDLGNHETFKEVEQNAEPILTAGDLVPNFKQILRNRIIYSPRYLMIVAFFTIFYDILSAADVKYSSLYYHLRKQSRETAPIKSPHPNYFRISLGSFFFSSIALIVIAYSTASIGNGLDTIAFFLTLGFTSVSFLFLIIIEAIWQIAFNKHIKVLRKMGYK